MTENSDKGLINKIAENALDRVVDLKSELNTILALNKMTEILSSIRLEGEPPPQLRAKLKKYKEQPTTKKMDPQLAFDILLVSDDVHKAITQVIQKIPSTSPRDIVQRLLSGITESTLFAFLEDTTVDSAIGTIPQCKENFPGVLTAITFQKAVSDEMGKEKLHPIEEDISHIEWERRNVICNSVLQRMREILTGDQ